MILGVGMLQDKFTGSLGKRLLIAEKESSETVDLTALDRSIDMVSELGFLAIPLIFSNRHGMLVVTAILRPQPFRSQKVHHQILVPISNKDILCTLLFHRFDHKQPKPAVPENKERTGQLHR